MTDQGGGLARRGREETGLVRRAGPWAGGGAAVAVTSLGIASNGPAVLHVLAAAGAVVTTPEALGAVAGAVAGVVTTNIVKRTGQPHTHWDYEPFDHREYVTPETRVSSGTTYHLCVHGEPVDHRPALRRLVVPAVAFAAPAGAIAAAALGLHVDPAIATGVLTVATAAGGFGAATALTTRPPRPARPARPALTE